MIDRDRLYPGAGWPRVAISPRRYLASLVVVALLVVAAIAFLSTESVAPCHSVSSGDRCFQAGCDADNVRTCIATVP